MTKQTQVNCPNCGKAQKVDPSATNQCPQCLAWHTGSGDQLVPVHDEQPASKK